MDLTQHYREMVELTRPICAACVPPFHCCAPVGCGQATVWARSKYGVALEYTSDNAISAMPYLTKEGCTVAPHLRPLCSLWLCPEAEEKAPDRYWELKAEITRNELNKHQQKGDLCRK